MQAASFILQLVTTETSTSTEKNGNPYHQIQMNLGKCTILSVIVKENQHRNTKPVILFNNKRKQESKRFKYRKQVVETIQTSSSDHSV